MQILRKLLHFVKLTPIIASILLCITGHANSSREQLQRSNGRPVTVADAIQMVTLGDDPAYNDGIVSSGQIAVFSPNGKRFVIVLRKGNIPQNTSEYSLFLWQANGTKSWTYNGPLFTLSSSSNRPGIEAVQWLKDNETITFLGEKPGGLHQLYHFDIKTRKLEKETHSQTNVLTYSETSDSGDILYTTEEPETSLFDKVNQGGAIVTSQPINEIFTGRVPPFVGGVQLLYQSRKTASFRRLAGRLLAQVPYYIPLLSPNGKYAVVPISVAHVPPSWGAYSDPSDPYFRLDLHAALSGEPTQLMQYIVIDTNTGKRHVLLDAPTGSMLGSEAAWSPDSRSIVITNTFLPLGHINELERRARTSTEFTIEIDRSSGAIAQLWDRNLHSPNWDSESGCLTFTPRTADLNWNSSAPIFFRKFNDRWQKVSPQDCKVATHPTVTLKEGMNTPPSIVIAERRQTKLLDLNPQFKKLRFAHEEALQVKGSSGEIFKAGLYYPVGYKAGKKYPLVVQTHGFNPDRFWITGPYSGTAFAAQPLAGVGIMVVQLDEDDHDVGTPQELKRETDRIEATVNDLDHKGLIDHNRIGIIGFSRTCLFTKYALTQSKIRFAAATTSDGVDDGYFQYMLMNDSGFQRLSEGAFGAPPFGSGLELWFARSPGFNLDKVRTPLRIEALNPNSALFQWEWFAGLRRLGKPVEMVLLQDGVHILQKPSDRLISQQGDVDWFRFWLQGYEDPDPAKAAQYKRWERLRKLQQVVTIMALPMP